MIRCMMKGCCHYLEKGRCVHATAIGSERDLHNLSTGASDSATIYLDACKTRDVQAASMYENFVAAEPTDRDSARRKLLASQLIMLAEKAKLAELVARLELELLAEDDASSELDRAHRQGWNMRTNALLVYLRAEVRSREA